MPETSPYRLTPAAALLLLIPPLMWAGNAVIGRLAAHWIPPITLNLLRWTLAFILLLPLAGRVLRTTSPMWSHWKRFSLLGLLGIGAYNTLQYLALQTSTPTNVTLVAASTPAWMVLLGRLFFGAPLSARALAGLLLSLAGVMVVLSQGEPARLLDLKLVPGDAWMLLASLLWAYYSWLLTQPREPRDLRGNWAEFLLAQIALGLLWSGLLAGAEWTWIGLHPDTSLPQTIQWGWPLAGVLLYVAIGPALLAYRCWGAGVRLAGPTAAGFFSNLTPLFAAVMSAAFLGELPQLYHAAAFALIIGGILVSSIKR